MLKGVVCSLIGLVGVSFAVGCSAPPPVARQRVETPTSAAKVTSSLTTYRATGVKTWQIYRGYGQTTALGFDKNGKPGDGIRFKITTDGKLSFKTLKRGGELVIDRNGKVTKNTLKDSEVGMLYGGTSVLTAYAAKASTGSMLPKSYRPFASAVSCGVSALNALYGCGKLVKTCIPAVRAGALGGAVAGSIAGPGATIGAVAGGAVGAAGCIAANPGEAIGCGTDGYEAYDTCKSYLTGENGTSEQKAEQQAETQSKQQEQKSEQQQTNEQQTNAQQTNEQQTNEQQTNEQQTNEQQTNEQQQQTDQQNQGCTDTNDPACAQNTEQNTEQNTQQNNEEPQNQEDQVEQNQNNQEELDPNPQDPQVEQEQQSQDPVAAEPESQQFGNDTGDPNNGGGGGDVETASISILTVKTSTSKKTAAGLGGACRARHVIQCGTRSSSSYCRCVPL